MVSTYLTKSPEQTIKLGEKLAGRLQGGDVVLLYGELGSGKTHFIKGIAKGLGIKMTIKSPTYAYVNQYPIVGQIVGPVVAHKVFYHYDLYRFEEGDDLSSIGFDETIDDPNAINVVEWADRLGDELPTQYISVSLKGTGEKRKIKIEFVSSATVPEEQIEVFHGEWATPEHVQSHCKMVTKVAMKIADAYMRQGEIVNANLLYSACMLHDVNRVCDFEKLDRDKFKEEVTNEKWEKWQQCRRDFKGMHHADITARIFNERGFPETAELIRVHKSINIVEDPKAYDTLEKKIIYYADKRVKHDEIVDLKERFRDGKERHGVFNAEKEKGLFDEVEKETFQLEKELFKGLDIKPGDIS